MEQDQLWAIFMQATLAGYSASENEGFSLGHHGEVAHVAASRADYALQEFNKRWGKDGQTKA